MTYTAITTIDTLKEYLYRALQLEHATIPPYLTALYSIHPQTNSDAYHVLRVIVVEEMLHLTIAANLMNAVGGTPDLTRADFVPQYPTYLPDGEKDFQVNLERFSPSAIDTFLKIERPKAAPSEEQRRVVRRPRGIARLASCPENQELEFYSIGEFYTEIKRGFDFLYEQQGASLFSGDRARQVTSEYYYSGGGTLHAVTCIDSARAAIDLVIGQGEGLGGGIYDSERELAHFYRFEQLRIGRYYQPGDKPHEPSGPPLQVDWQAAYPTVTNPRIETYHEVSRELYQTALAFNRAYASFLALLTEAFNGKPALLLEAVPKMFTLRDAANMLIRNPLPGSNAQTDSTADCKPGALANAAPTFEIGECSR